MTRPRKSMGLGRPIRKTVYLTESVAKAAAFDLENNRFNDVVQAYLEAHYVGGGGLATLERRKVDLRQVIDRAQIELASIDQQTQAVQEVSAVLSTQAKNEQDFMRHVYAALERNNGQEPDWKNWLHAGRSDVKAIGGLNRAKELLRNVGVDV